MPGDRKPRSRSSSPAPDARKSARVIRPPAPPRGRTASNPDSGIEGSAIRLRALFDTAVEGIITIDVRGIIESANKATRRIFGYETAELIGRNVSMLMPQPFSSEHDGYIQRYLSSGTPNIIGIGREVTGRRKDGTEFPMDLSVGEFVIEGKRYFTGIIRDITARKEAELKVAEMTRILREKNKELETVVYVASHDLRSPLVNIQGFSKELSRACKRLKELMNSGGSAEQLRAELKDLINEDIDEALSYILNGVSKMDSLLSGFLRFSRLGRAAIRIQATNTEGMIREILDSMDFQVREAQADVTITPLPVCLCDPVLSSQVFANILDNAIKYRHPERKPKIQISGNIQGGEAIYCITDNGIGIEPEHQTKVFEIFYRLNPDSIQGEGLGLTIAQRILERQNGRIWVEGRPGEGSSFFVALPIGLI